MKNRSFIRETVWALHRTCRGVTFLFPTGRTDSKVGTEPVRRYEERETAPVLRLRSTRLHPPWLAPPFGAAGGHLWRRWPLHRWQRPSRAVGSASACCFGLQHVRRSSNATAATSRCAVTASLIQACCDVASAFPTGRMDLGPGEACHPSHGDAESPYGGCGICVSLPLHVAVALLHRNECKSEAVPSTVHVYGRDPSRSSC